MPLQEKSLSEIFNQLKEFNEAVQSKRGGDTFAYKPEAMENVLESWGNTPTRLPRPPRIDPNLINQWKSNADYPVFLRLSAAAIRFLCWEPSVATDPKFHSYLESQPSPPSPKALRGLLYCYHLNWSRTEEDTQKIISRSLANWIRSYSGSNSTILNWQRNLETLVGPSASFAAAKRLERERPDNLDRFREDLGIYPDTKFWSSAVNLASEMIIENFHNMEISSARWLTKVLWASGNIEGTQLASDFSLAVLNSRTEGDEAMQEIFREFGLQKFRDPRISTQHWHLIDPEAQKRFISWLSRSDIKFFFELIIGTGKDPHGRKPFWLRYISKMVRTQVLIHPQDAERLRWELHGAEERGQTWGKIKKEGGHYTSAFILDFGKVLAVEFSQTNNACQLYGQHHALKTFESFYGRSWRVTELKNGDLPKVTHQKNWEEFLANNLARYGIYPD
jgi:hypothetical protein